jgi:predicted transposase/invertase (TIGR01784 family)
LQRIKQGNFKDRCLFYASQVIQQQAPKGNWNFELMPVYTIGILDFELDDYKLVDTLLHRISLRDEQGHLFSEKMMYIYMELPKFTKTLEELKTQFDKWLFVFRWLSKLNSRPKALQERVFQKIFDIANIANFTSMERSQYEISLKIRRDNQNAMEYMRQEALREGREQGIEKKSVEILKTGLKKGQSLATLADILNMPLDELEALARKYELL